MVFPRRPKLTYSRRKFSVLHHLGESMHLSSRSLLLSTTALAGALALQAGTAQAQMYSTGPGVYLSAEGRYMWNAGDKVKNYTYDYGYPGSSSFLFEPYSTSKTAADKGWGGKAMLGYRFNNNWDVGVGASGGWLKGKDDTSTYNYSQGESILTDKLKVTFDYVTVDFEAGYNMPVGVGSTVRLFGGLRFAHLDQKATGSVLNLLYNTGHGVYYDYSGKRKTTFTGVGPRVGANGTFGLGGGFNIFGGLSGALLVGKYKDKHELSYLGTNDASSSDSYTDQNKTKVVPNVDGEIGIGYNFGTGAGSTVGIQLGYRGEAFFGAATKGHVDGPYNKEKASGDYLLHGPFVRLVATFGSAPAAPPPPPPPPPAATAKKSFIVFFDFDKSNITSQAQTTINDAVAAAKAGNSARVTLTGHTDRSGSEQYNMALSLRRAEAVKANMIKQGIPASAIVVIGKGESQPLVPTADGVREPQNRRVEIVI